MNREESKILAPIIKAYGDNKEIEYFNGKEWESCEHSVGFLDKPEKYRIKPQSKLVPFTFEDNLLGKIVVYSDESKAMITAQKKDGVYIGGSLNLTSYSNLMTFVKFEDYSPCGKYINE